MEDFLKYHRPIMKYIQVKYGIKQDDIDMMLFLYSEGSFSKARFAFFDKVVRFDRNRFNRLIDDGWIVKVRDLDRSKVQGARFKLTYKANRMIKSLYDKMTGKEIPVRASDNKLFYRSVSYKQQAYKDMIKAINKETKAMKLKQHLSPAETLIDDL